METSATESQDVDPVDLYLAYDFSADEQYQEGLRTIAENLASQGISDEEKQAILFRSQVFYFKNVKGYTITPEDVQQRLQKLQHAASATGQPVLPISHEEQVAADASKPRILSFAELTALIEQGKTDQIPNNRVIPNGLNKTPPSESKAAVRKKPWEVIHDEQGRSV